MDYFKSIPMSWEKQPFSGDSSTDLAVDHAEGATAGAAEAEAVEAMLALQSGSAETCGVQVCERCFACSRDKVELWRHVRDAHGDDTRLVCPVARCGRRFSTLFTSAEHRSHHEPYTCELCGRLSPDRSAFDNHVAAEHRDARDLVCGVCGRFEVDVKSLAKHVRAAHGLQIWPEVMDVCETPSGGVGPERTRRRDVRYKPYECGKWYGTNRLRRSHGRLHFVAESLQQQPDAAEPVDSVFDVLITCSCIITSIPIEKNI